MIALALALVAFAAWVQDPPAGEPPPQAGEAPAQGGESPPAPADEPTPGDAPAGDPPSQTGEAPAQGGEVPPAPADEPPPGDPPPGDPPPGDPPSGDPPPGDPPSGDPPSGDPPPQDEAPAQGGENPPPPADDVPVSDPPVGEQPTGEQPASEQPTGEQQAGERPAGEPSAGQSPAVGPPAQGGSAPAAPDAAGAPSTSAELAAAPEALATEPGGAPAFDCLAPLGPGGLRERFAEIAARHPAHARLELLPLAPDASAPVLVLGALEGAERRPALALYGWDDPSTWRAALAIAQALLEERAAPGLLERATLYLLPVLHEPSAPAGIDAARNFPIGWRPETLVQGAGPYPLAAPAARALAGFLDAHPSLSLLLALEDAPCAAPELPELEPERYRRELFAGEPPAAAPAALCPATVASFAWAALGVFPARVATPPLLDPLERQRAAIQGRAVLDVAERALPRLTLSAPSVQPLRSGEVRLDLAVENAGWLPTLSAIGIERRHAGPVELAIEGARVLACAAGPTGAALDVRRAAAGRYPLGQIPGRGRVDVCLVLAGEPGAQVVLTCSSPRAGSASLAVTLP